MSAPGKILSTVHSPARGLIAFPAIVVCTYALLCHLLYLHFVCTMRIDHSFEFWSLPQFAGLSLLDLFTVTNVLFFGYLIVFAWSFFSRQRHRSKGGVLFWGTLLFLIALLAGLQVYQAKVGAIFRLPDKILSLRTEQFHDYRGRGLEDLVLAKSDRCEGISKPFEERCTINITRPGHFVRNRRDLGPVADAHDEIRSQLIDEVSRAPRRPDGASKLILRIRADREAEFGPIHEVMELCGEKEIGIYRIEFACLCDLNRRVPEAAEKLSRYYSLPEGKLDASLPRGADTVSTIDAALRHGEETEENILCTVNGKSIEGADLPRSFFDAISALHSVDHESKIVISVPETVAFDHIIALLAECRRAKIEHVAFKISQDD